MKKCVVFAAVISVFFALPVRAQYLEAMQIGILQAVGIDADYDSGTTTITWSGGQDGWVLSDDMSSFIYFSDLPNFDSVTATATFTGMADYSSGTQAAASFSTGTWSIALDANGTNVMSLAGHILGKYNETEVDNTNKLDGRAIVTIDTASFDEDYWASTDVGVIGLDDALVGMIADITLPSEPAFDSYVSDDYASTNVVVTLYADESVVPEPATMTLLALGGLLLRKRS